MRILLTRGPREAVAVVVVKQQKSEGTFFLLGNGKNSAKDSPNKESFTPSERGEKAGKDGGFCFPDGAFPGDLWQFEV